MAEQKKDNQFWIGFTLTAVIGISLAIAMTGATYGSESAGPNVRGATIPQVVDPTDTKVQLFQSTLKDYTDPTVSAAEKADKLTLLSSQLSEYQVVIDSKDSTLPAATKTALDNEIQKAQKTITALKQKAAKPGTGTAEEKTQLITLQNSLQASSDTIMKLLRDSHALSGNRAARIIALAKAIIAQNNNGDAVGGKHPIPYSESGGYSIAAGMDCSGFISYLFEEVGLLGPGVRTSTADLPSRSNLVDTVKDASGGALTIADLTGILQPGDILVSSSSHGNHMVMYLGGSFDDPQSVAQSTTTNTKSGPQYTSITARMSGGRDLQYVLRPHYDS